MRTSLVVPSVFLAAIAASAGFLAGAGRDPAADARLLTKLDDEWSKAAATRDAVKIAAFYAEDGNAFPPGAPLASGRAAAQQVWAAALADPSSFISWKTTRAEVAASGDLGYTIGTYEAGANGPDGKPVKEQGKYLCVWRKQKDGSWKAIQDMWNADGQ